MTSYIGDFNPSDVFDLKFCTVGSTGAPTVLTTSPAVSIYKDNGTGETTTGVTLTTNFDSVTGLNNVNVDTSTSAGFYAAGHNFQAVITAGTVGGVTVSGYVVGQFSIQARSPLRPTTAGRTLDVSSGGEAGLDWANIGSPTATVSLTNTTMSATQIAASVTGAVGSVTGAVGSIASGGIVTASIATGAIVTGSFFAGSITNAVVNASENNAIADAFLARNIEGGSSVGRTVSESLFPLRNKFSVNTSSGVYSVYKTDDTTLGWTSTLTTNASAEPITGSDPS